VIVRDTTAPAILWSFTNVVLAADTNCTAPMPDVTGTNFILATDLSGALTISQSPTNNSVLPFGTNAVVIAVEDAFGNASVVTNTVTVLDQTPPLIVSQPQSQTNTAGTSASFSVAATACTPLAFQWTFNGAALAGQTGAALALTNVNANAAGNYAVVVIAAGGASTSVVATLTVNLLGSSVALVSSANPSGYLADLNFTAAVAPPVASGTIQFSTDGVAFESESLVAGQAVSTNIASLPRGTNLILATYSGDADYLPFTNTLAQIITNHPPTAAPAFYTNTAGFALNIPIAELAVNWSDVDGDAVFLAGFDISTNGITLTNNGTALVYSNANNTADQFVCIIADGWGGTNFQTVAIAAAPPANSHLFQSEELVAPAGVRDGKTFHLPQVKNAGRDRVQLRSRPERAGRFEWVKRGARLESRSTSRRATAFLRHAGSLLWRHAHDDGFDVSAGNQRTAVVARMRSVPGPARGIPRAQSQFPV
jgi:hypothetical protein